MDDPIFKLQEENLVLKNEIIRMRTEQITSSEGKNVDYKKQC